MASAAVRLAAELQRLLQRQGYEVSRHASSMIILARGRLAATLHVYPDICRLNLYRPWASLLAEDQEAIRRLLEKHCPRLELGEAPYG